MIAVDTNILVYAHRQKSDFHEAASEALQTLSLGRCPLGHSVAVLLRVSQRSDQPPDLERCGIRTRAGMAATNRVGRIPIKSPDR